MKHMTPLEARAVAQAADRQMRRWAATLQVQARLEPRAAAARLPAETRPWVAISREAGAGGGELARYVASALGCECLDNELLTVMAERYRVPPGVLAFVDEKVSGWLRQILLLWLDGRVISQDEYVLRVGEIALLAARHAPTVFVGRGIQFLLPRERGLAVRVIAPREQRVERTMAARRIDRKAAELWVEEADAGRRHMIEHHFHVDPADPALYDLTLNLARLDLVTAAEIVAGAFQGRFGED
jgi:Cytidylate kinase-like family